MNPISDRIKTGTLGELLVQLRLLQYDVQAAPPIKDSGNDLVAVNGSEFRAVQVRTTTSGTYGKPRTDRRYDVLAVVALVGSGNDIDLEASRVYLISEEDVASAPTNCQQLERYALNRSLVQNLFGSLSA